MNKNRKYKKRWAFSKLELEYPEMLTSNDELIADVGEELGVIVYRDGSVSNRWEDGTAGVPDDLKDIAYNVETLYHPETNEETYVWKNVLVDSKGRFIDFI